MGTFRSGLVSIQRFRVQLSSPLLTLALTILPAMAQVTTSQYDNARTGANLRETILTPRNVNSVAFGKIFTLPVDGDIYAQPLYLPHVPIPARACTTCCSSRPNTTAFTPSMLTAARPRLSGVPAS